MDLINPATAHGFQFVIFIKSGYSLAVGKSESLRVRAELPAVRYGVVEARADDRRSGYGSPYGLTGKTEAEHGDALNIPLERPYESGHSARLRRILTLREHN